MRYGGHQTFTIRDGWLHKALVLLTEERTRYQLVDDFAMDYLGVGRNMAKSINHWLIATGLAKKVIVENDRGKTVEKKDLEPSELGKLVFSHDPYFMDEGTWWFLHTNLVSNPDDATTWHWFFNQFGQERFIKRVCLNGLSRYESMQSSRSTSTVTLERDLSCFLASYSQEVPAKNEDPEDEIICPFVDLGLMTYYRSSGYYNVIRKFRDIDPNIFLYSLSKLEDHESFPVGKKAEINFFDLLAMKNSPSRIFLLGNDDLYELLLSYTNNEQLIQLTGLAGSHKLIFETKKALDHVKNYYYQRKVAQ